MRKISPLLLCVAALGGCADTRWHKTGADPAMLERDLEQCSGMVALQIPRAPSIPRSMGTITGSAGAYPIVVDTGGAQGADALDRLQREEALLSSCMNGKGYARVSASEANRK